MFHSENTAWMSKKEDLNIAAWLTIFGNLPKLIVGLVLYILSQPQWLRMLEREKPAIRAKMKELDIDEYSEDGFRYIAKHSELLQRFIFETERMFFIAPVLPRINANIFFNRIGPWGDDMALAVDDQGHTVTSLPQRSFAIVPLRALATDETCWKSPDEFNPLRDEYQLEARIDANDPIRHGQVRSIGQEPMAFGNVSSKRTCPGRHITQDIAIACLWSLSDLYQIELTPEERAHLVLPDIETSHHMRLELETEMPIKGMLYQLEKARTDALENVSEVSRVNPHPPLKVKMT